MNITARYVPMLRLPVLYGCLALTFAAGGLQAAEAVRPVMMSKEQIAAGFSRTTSPWSAPRRQYDP